LLHDPAERVESGALPLAIGLPQKEHVKRRLHRTHLFRSYAPHCKASARVITGLTRYVTRSSRACPLEATIYHARDVVEAMEVTRGIKLATPAQRRKDGLQPSVDAVLSGYSEYYGRSPKDH
jgi:hypothetical protein